VIRPKFVLFAIIALSITASRVHAQQELPSTENAALRYWLAFAELQDVPADKETQDLLESVASGAVPWDEQRLGALLDQNGAAIRAMHRATALPECDWGLEYERGWRASIAPVVKGRVLARLNVLYGMRQAARGDTAGAVETWIHGLRFAEHLSQGFSLVGALIAKSALLADLGALLSAVESGSLGRPLLDRVAIAIRAMPPEGPDWSAAVRYEAAVGAMAFNELAESSDPHSLFEAFFREPAPSSLTVPSSAEIAQFQTLMEKAAATLRLNYAAAPELDGLQRQIAAIHPVIERALPSLTRVSAARLEATAARQALLDAIAARTR
jgi:hypothetical protein